MILHGIEYQRPTSLNMRILADHVTYSFLAFMKSIFHFCLGCYCGGYSQNGRSNLSSWCCVHFIQGYVVIQWYVVCDNLCSIMWYTYWIFMYANWTHSNTGMAVVILLICYCLVETRECWCNINMLYIMSYIVHEVWCHWSTVNLWPLGDLNKNLDKSFSS